jgi:3'-phosphoadenosine 5'-phosphosulfate sulfotransferase (PAPS reductase)/FAD synthetase
MKSIEEARIETAQEILDEAEARDPVKTYCLFSGGHDSLVATHVAHEWADPDGVVHINTGRERSCATLARRRTGT